ncbi:hypothetical protein FJ872_23520 [Mesorhizobium sp. B2-5-9]|uniref:hypothetical protein n=1 Tax=Mesorhizobium sp. B2-5-9 TaxID=2589921 RepID=UPI00112C1DD8|nr:hypothetical protein [Mesorhizobium sp. B2-5-9]TPK07986.1 hypothetical protein FJ872_23520 [Mesorhizobium sp. B2-5-9]
MDFVELHRWFAPISKDQELNADYGAHWGARLSGWMDWSGLLQLRRVVILAEAASGKSEEFRNQARQLSTQGKPSFYLRIEELADQGFEAALGWDEAQKYEAWRTGSTEGWFFLDSIDEARLNRKSFESALKRFARESGPALERANIFISCRVTDWRNNDDRRAIREWLPAHRRAETAADRDNEAKLLNPLFDERKTTEQTEKPVKAPYELLVVQIVPLDSKQSALLASAAGVADSETFAVAIVKAGLDAFRQRPGDVLDLASYWDTHKAFGSLAAMVDYGIERKLTEHDPHRTDNDVLAPAKARQGAESLAAALTLGKSFTLRAPGGETDPSLMAAAIEPARMLDKWSDAERNALLRRGIFAPSTFGRIRFHHRGTQEYLAARWLDRLLEDGCPRAEVWNLIFVERYGVETLVPSLRPAAAWLALWHADFGDEIIRREPIVLMKHGDPRSLTIDSRRQILAALAKLHAEGEIPDTSLDSRNFAMFADARLATDIIKAWEVNSHDDFRFILLRLISDGAIPGCEVLLREAASAEGSRNYRRIAAIEAMKASGDHAGCRQAAREALAHPGALSAYMAAGIAQALYPNFLTTDDLLRLVVEAKPPHSDTGEGFARAIAGLYQLATTPQDRAKIVERIGDLCLMPPLVESYSRVSVKHGYLADHLRPIAAAEIKVLGDKAPSQALVRLLMAIERADRSYSVETDEPPLRELVQANPRLNRALLWADVADTRSLPAERPVDRHWRIYFGSGNKLWGASEQDLEWLFDDALMLPEIDDRRVALSLIVPLIKSTGRETIEQERLQTIAATAPALAEDLAAYNAPLVEREEDRKYRAERESYKRERSEQQEGAKASWVKFADSLRADPGQLSAPANLVSWQAGIHRLKHLTHWLQRKTGLADHDAPREWRLLEEGFGRPVAEAYRDGMMTLWRSIEPKRPQREAGGAVTHQWTHTLAFAGIGIAAREEPDWPLALTTGDAERIARHACFTEQGYPEWLDNLLLAHPKAALSAVARELGREWRSAELGRTDFLYHYGSAEALVFQPLQTLILKTIARHEAGRVETIERMIVILRKFALDERLRLSLLKSINARFALSVSAAKEDFATANLGLLFVIDPDWAAGHLDEWIGSDEPASGQTRVARVLAALFDGHHRGLVVSALDRASVAMLARLLRFSYRHIRPKDDVYHVGSFSPDVRFNAESARNTILSKLLDRPGPDAFWCVRRLPEQDPAFTDHAERFRELAHAKAEKDCEPPAWNTVEVRQFERTHTAPIKTGADLMHVVMSVLGDISFQLKKGDVSSRPLLERAKDEDEARNWLTEQLILRAKGQFHAYREAEVALSDRPDIVIASTSAQCEVAIEVKHGGMGWTMRQLDHALRTQLAEDYLKPITRRHGILIVTNHTSRIWIDPQTNERHGFEKLISILAATASGIIENSSGAIEVACVGVDATASGV